MTAAPRVAVAEFQQETCGLSIVPGNLETDGWEVTTRAALYSSGGLVRVGAGRPPSPAPRPAAAFMASRLYRIPAHFLLNSHRI